MQWEGVFNADRLTRWRTRSRWGWARSGWCGSSVWSHSWGLGRVWASHTGLMNHWGPWESDFGPHPLIKEKEIKTWNKNTLQTKTETRENIKFDSEDCFDAKNRWCADNINTITISYYWNYAPLLFFFKCINRFWGTCGHRNRKCHHLILHWQVYC